MYSPQLIRRGFQCSVSSIPEFIYFYIVFILLAKDKAAINKINTDIQVGGEPT